MFPCLSLQFPPFSLDNLSCTSAQVYSGIWLAFFIFIFVVEAKSTSEVSFPSSMGGNKSSPSSSSSSNRETLNEL